MKTLSPILVVCFILVVSGAVAKAETVFFLMSGPAQPATNTVYESYVVGVSDPALIQRARDYLRAGAGAPYLVPHVRVAPGADEINRNYADPDHPKWTWHITEFVEWTNYDPSQPGPTVFIPEKDSAPSDVPQLIAGDAFHEPVDSVALRHYPLVMELAPDTETNVVAVSTRGWVDRGERILIAGFVVQGGTPRNLVIRGIGPSMGPLGVSEPLPNPSIRVYHGSELIALNHDWQDGNFVPEPGEAEAWYAWLFPTNPREAALRLSLPPGTYTVHLLGDDPTPGVGLVEVYDLDALKPQ